MRRQELSKKYASQNSTKTHCKNHSKIVQKGVGDCKRGISHKYATICTEHEKQNLQQNPRFRVATLNAKKYSEVLVQVPEQKFIGIIKNIPPTVPQYIGY